MFEKIKKFYNLGLYTDEILAKFVEKGVLSTEQYIEITGKSVTI